MNICIGFTFGVLIAVVCWACVLHDNQKQMQDKMRNVQQQPGSLATTGGTQQVESSPDDQVFNTILGNDTELEKAFSF